MLNIIKAAYINLIPPELFDTTISIEDVKSLFSRYVEVVEIENHNYCNRTCWFCPNSYIDRQRESIILPNNIFKSVINDLSSIDYKQTIVWSMYHEPLAHKSIFERISLARRSVQKASLVMFSNGDYLNRETLMQLESAGLNRLIINKYVDQEQKSGKIKLDEILNNISRKTKLAIEGIGTNKFALLHSSINITLKVQSFSKDSISNRGGLMSIDNILKHSRNVICIEPVRHVVIDFNGKCMLCCQTRSDSPKHRHAIIGDLNEHGYSIYHYYRDLAPIRKSLLMKGQNKGVCLKCNSQMLCPDIIARREWLFQFLKSIPWVQNLFELMLERRSTIRTYEK